MTPMRDQLPHKGIEAWKWTDLRAAVGAEALDGFDTPLRLSIDPPEGLSLAGPDMVTPNEPMGLIAAEYADGEMSIVVPDGAAPEAPLEIRDIGTGNARFRIEVGRGASLEVREHHAAPSGFANLDIHYVVKAGGRLHRTVATDDGEGVIRHVRAQVTLWDEAAFEQVLLTTGSRLTRLETRLACMGAAKATLSGAYMLSGQRHADITNYTDLTAPGCVIRDEVAGVVTDKARSVFQGKFHVRRPAQHTDAEMRHDALMLSETSKVNAKPELEIYADDVECAHGNTVGQLDENALFYMRQRGIPLTLARALLLEAFLVAKLGRDDVLEERVQSWLEART